MHIMEQLDILSLPSGTLIVSYDVQLLYSNIRHTDGIQAIQYFLNKQMSQDMAHNSFLVSLLNFVL